MPHTVTHNAASVDGRIDGIEVDLGTFYGLAGRLEADAHLVGADTLIQGMGGADGDPGDEPGDQPELPEDAPPVAATEGDGDESSTLLVVPDSRGRDRDWPAVLSQPFWDEVVVLCSRATEDSYLDGLAEVGVHSIVVGEDHVDFAEALPTLEADYGVGTVLVDSGGTLNGHLLRGDLVDEVSVLVHPQVVGGTSARSFFRGPDPSEDAPVADCSLETIERVDGGLVWLRYSVATR